MPQHVKFPHATRLDWNNYATGGCAGEMWLCPHEISWDPRFREEIGVNLWVECVGHETTGIERLNAVRDGQIPDIERELERKSSEFFMKWCH